MGLPDKKEWEPTLHSLNIAIPHSYSNDRIFFKLHDRATLKYETDVHVGGDRRAACGGCRGRSKLRAGLQLWKWAEPSGGRLLHGDETESPHPRGEPKPGPELKARAHDPQLRPPPEAVTCVKSVLWGSQWQQGAPHPGHVAHWLDVWTYRTPASPRDRALNRP